MTLVQKIYGQFLKLYMDSPMEGFCMDELGEIHGRKRETWFISAGTIQGNLSDKSVYKFPLEEK